MEKKNAITCFDRCINKQYKELEFEQKERQKLEDMLIKDSKVKRDEKLAHELKQLKDSELLEQQKRLFTNIIILYKLIKKYFFTGDN